MRLPAAARGSADLWMLTALTVGAFCTFAVINPVWVNRNLVQTMVSQSAALALVAVPLTFSIISRNIDLSVGSVLALQGMVLGRVQESASLDGRRTGGRSASASSSVCSTDFSSPSWGSAPSWRRSRR